MSNSSNLMTQSMFKSFLESATNPTYKEKPTSTKYGADKEKTEYETQLLNYVESLKKDYVEKLNSVKEDIQVVRKETNDNKVDLDKSNKRIDDLESIKKVVVGLLATISIALFAAAWTIYIRIDDRILLLTDKNTEVKVKYQEISENVRLLRMDFSKLDGVSDQVLKNQLKTEQLRDEVKEIKSKIK